MNASPKRFNTLWILTGFVTLLLIVMTIFTVVRASKVRETGFAGYITGSNSAIYLRERPSGSAAIVSILELGVAVSVTDAATQSNINWYHVETGTVAGWVPAERVSTEPP